MSKRILVTYASRCGSTFGVAQAIADTLMLAGARVDVLPVRVVSDLAPYEAVVAGSAILGGKWLPEAMRFVEKYQSALARRPFAAFLVCMSLASHESDNRAHVATWLAPVRARVHPLSEGLFAGALEVGEISSTGNRFKSCLNIFTRAWPPGDYRDWGAIDCWAQQLYPLLMSDVVGIQNRIAVEGALAESQSPELVFSRQV